MLHEERILLQLGHYGYPKALLQQQEVLQCLANAASSTERLNSSAHQDGHRIPLRLLPYLSHAGSNREKNTPIIIQQELPAIVSNLT